MKSNMAGVVTDDSVVLVLDNRGSWNRVNNVLATLGVFRGTLDVRASDIKEEFKIAAVKAIAYLISTEEINQDYFIPNPFDARVVSAVVKALALAAIEPKVVRL